MHAYSHTFKMPFTEGRYSPDRLRRNRVAIVTAALAGVAASVVGSALTDWPMNNALGIAAVWLVICAALWWLFGSRGAGPVQMSAGSQGWFKSVSHPYRRRL